MAVNELQQYKVRPLEFEEGQHKTFCAELKYLYTVITRARNHLWIFESSIEASLPMMSYWTRRNVVKVVTDGTSYSYMKEQLEEVAASVSERAEWKKHGDELSELELWEQAMKCYRKAKEPLLEKITSIQLLHKEAATAIDKKRNQRQTAATHLICDKIQHDVKHLMSAAICLRNAEMYQISATLLEKLHEVSSNNQQFFVFTFSLYNTVQQGFGDLWYDWRC